MRRALALGVVSLLGAGSCAGGRPAPPVPAPPIAVSIDVASPPLATLSRHMVGTGVEFLNHEVPRCNATGHFRCCPLTSAGVRMFRRECASAA